MLKPNKLQLKNLQIVSIFVQTDFFQQTVLHWSCWPKKTVDYDCKNKLEKQFEVSLNCFAA